MSADDLAYLAPPTAAGVPPARGSIDDTAFPVVRLLAPGESGYAFAWGAALRRVIEHGLPFVLVDSGVGEVETAADKKLRGQWVRKHAERLVSLCRGLILVQADVALRMQAREQAQRVIGELPLRVVVVSKVAVAEQLAHVLLADHRRGGSRVVSR